MDKGKNYWLGVVFLGTLALLSPLYRGGESWHTVIWLRPGILGFALFYFLAQSREGRLELKTPAGGWLILGLILCLSASLLTTHYYYITIYWYLTFLVYLLLFGLCLNLFAGSIGPQLISALLKILVLAALSQSLAGIIQFLAFHPARVSGAFFNPAYYAGYLAGLLPFPLASLMFDLVPEISSRKKLALKFSSGILTILICGALIFSASRSFVFALIPLCLIPVIRYKSKAVLALIALLLALAIIPNPLRTRLKNLSQDPYAWERVNVWRGSLTMIRHHPLGVGLGMYQYYSQRYQEPFQGIKYGRYGLLPSQAHNEFLNFAAECSPLTPLLGLAFLVLIFARAFRALKNSRQDPARFGLLAAFSASLLAILGHSLVDYNLHQPPIMVLAVFDLAALISLIAQNDASALKEKTLARGLSALRGLALVLGLILIPALACQGLLDGILNRARSDQDHSRAISTLHQLSLLPSGNAEIYFQLGANLAQAFENAGSVMFATQAIAELERAINLNPENQEYYYELARANYLLGTFLNRQAPIKEAKKYAQQAIRVAPGQVFSYLLLSDLCLVEQDYPASKSALETALEYEPYFFKARSQLIRILSYERNPAAEKELEILLSQYAEVQEFLKQNPGILNSYQQQIVEIKAEQLNQLRSMLKPR